MMSWGWQQDSPAAADDKPITIQGLSGLIALEQIF